MAELKHTDKGWRYERVKWHLLRAKWWNYHNPSVYMLTMVTKGRKPLFGRLIGEHIELTELGEGIAEEIEQMPTYKGFESAEIYTYVVMPDHVHILLQVHERLPKVLGQYVSWFKRQCSLRAAEIETRRTNAASKTQEQNQKQDKEQNKEQTTANKTQEPTEASVASGSALAVKSASKPPLVFATEYHDRILTHSGQLANMRLYIQDNPRRLALKRANPDLFRLRTDIPVAGFRCIMLGNRFLLDYPMKGVIQCSRSLTQAEIDQEKEHCLIEAERGVVFVSGCISEGEKQICRALRESGFSLIILLKDGFPQESDPHYKYFKTQGVYFEACARGQLLLIEPNATIYEDKAIEQSVYRKTGTIPHDTSRYRFIALNELANNLI